MSLKYTAKTEDTIADIETSKKVPMNIGKILLRFGVTVFPTWSPKSTPNNEKKIIILKKSETTH